VWFVGAVLALTGCASTPPAPVEDRNIGGNRQHGRIVNSSDAKLPAGRYRVRRGDTLYSIAFRNGLDYRELARANDIAPPYTIFVDQVIQLDARVRSTRKPAVASRPTSPREQPVPATAGSRSTPPRSASASAQSPATAAPAVVAESAPAIARPAQLRSPSASTAVDLTPHAGIVWRWPADGPRDGGFVPGDQTRQGINITGKSGDAVRAAANGVVVYSGNGLIGYGELIIIKHNSEMLSAYGHNRRRLVQEGDRITAGQQIAEMGSTSASRDMLHFEIRRNGKPVDPLAYLPSR
jgi:lipoprotein NlpD